MRPETIEETFVREFTALMKHESNYSSSHGPTKKFDELHHTYIGTISCHITKELFAFVEELAKRSDADTDVDNIRKRWVQASTVQGMFLIWVRAIVPECSVLKTKSLLFLRDADDNWVVATDK